MAAYALLCLIWGTTWSVIQIGLAGIPPMSGVALRFALAAGLLLALARVRGIRLGARPHERALWLVNGLLGFTVCYGVVYWGEQWVPSGLAAVMFATYPFFLGILSHFLLPAERLSRLETLGILVGFLGIGIIFSDDFESLGGSRAAVAAGVLLVSPLAAAVASLAVKRWGAGIHPVSLSAVPMALTAIVTGGLALGLESDRTLVLDRVSIGALVYLAVAGSAISFTLYYWLLARLPAKRLALITYIIPIVAVLIGATRGEPVTAMTLAGSAVVIGGVALASHRPGR